MDVCWWKALAVVAADLAREGDHRQADALFEEAQEATRDIEDASPQEEDSTAAVVALVQAGRYKEAKQVARAIEDDLQRARALDILATTLAEVGCFCEAFALVHPSQLEE